MGAKELSKSSDQLQNGAFHWKSRETSAMYKALVEQIPAVLYVDADDEASSALYMSPQVEEMLGYTQEEWLDDPDLWVKLLHHKDRERALAAASHARTTGEPFDIEYRLVSRDGREMWVHDKAARVEVGDSVVWRGVLLDITERKQAREELRRSEELFRATFESAGVGMAHVSPDGRWLRVNEKLCEISGYSLEELTGMTLQELTPLVDRPASSDRTRRILEGKSGPYSVERRYVRKDGSRVWVNLSVSLVRKSSGEPDFLICVAEDITERKIAELVTDPVSEQELKVLHLIASGHTNAQIAEELCYSLGGVKHQIQSIIAKLGVKKRAQAATRAIEIGLTPYPD
ncbi:MAG: helix-turn-helix transcriptional regulator [Rubrobacteraceae bacterium]